MGLLHIHELICMMCWQMCPFPHTCLFGSVGVAGGGWAGRQVSGCPLGLGGQPAVLHTPPHTHTSFPSLFPFGFLCYPILPSLSPTGFLYLRHSSLCLSHSVSDFPISCSPSLHSHLPLSGSSCSSFCFYLSDSVWLSPTPRPHPSVLSISVFPPLSLLSLPLLVFPPLAPSFSCPPPRIVSYFSFSCSLTLSGQSFTQPISSNTP